MNRLRISALLALAVLTGLPLAAETASFEGFVSYLSSTNAIEPGGEPGWQTGPLECNQWYTVNDYCRKLVADCDKATDADYASVTRCALVNTNQFGSKVCEDLGCAHTQSGANPDVTCSCDNRILLCSVNMKVYCASA